MRIRKHSRITALVLALVMILPLISIPTFAEGEAAVPPVNYSQDFNTGNIGDTLRSWSSLAKVEDGALRIDYGAGSNGKYYLSTNSTTAKYEIASPKVESGTLVSGTVTIGGATYNVTGPVNSESSKALSQKATVKSAADGTDYTAAALYVVTDKGSDAIHGGINVGVQNKMKNGSISAADHSKITLSVDYFISSDVNKGAAFEITWKPTKRGTDTPNNNRVDIAKLGVDNDYVYLVHHADAGSPKTGNTNLRAPKGQWFNVKAILDFATKNIELYLNGDYGLTITDADLVDGLYANELNVLQINRGSTQAPSAMKGYVLIDNVSVTSENAVYSASDFNHYAGITSFRGGTYASNFGYPGGIPSKLTSVTENGNTYLKYNFGMDLQGESTFLASTGGVDGDGDGLVDFYAYSGYTRWAKNSQIASYDFNTHVLTLKDGTTYTVTAKNATQIAQGYYGDFQDGETKDNKGNLLTFKLTSPAYASAINLGDGNVDKNVSVRVSPYSYENYSELYFSAKYLIEPGSYGTAQSQFYNIVKNGTANTWNDLYTIDLATGAFSRGGYLKIGEWSEVGMKINLVSGDINFYVDGLLVATVTAPFGKNLQFRKSATEYGNCAWILAKQFKSTTVLDAKGSISVDDVKMTEISEMPPIDIVRVDFETETVGAAPSRNFASLAVADSVITDTLGSKAWKIDYDTANKTVAGHDKHGYNIDKSSKVKHPTLDYTKAKNIVLETSYFIDANAIGKLQSQFQTINVGTPIPDLDGTKYKYETTEDEAAGKFKTKNSAIWVDLYCIEFYGSNALLMRESGTKYGSYELYTGMWNTISLVLDLETGNVQYYVNGNHAFDGSLNATTDEPVTETKNNVPYEKIKVNADQWVVGKVNKVNGQGEVHIDDIKMYEGTTIRTQTTEKTPGVRDFEEFNYSDGKFPRFGGFTALPSLTTYKKEASGNVALRLDMGAGHSNEGWALVQMAANGSVNKVAKFDIAYTEGATTLHYDDKNYDVHINEALGLPYIELGSVKAYIVPNAYAEAAAGSSNVGAATTYAHDVYSYEKQKYVVFAEDLFIEEGSIGIVESQFAGYKYVDGEGETQSGGWLQLFHLYMENGLLHGQYGENMGVKFEMGKWNNVKVVGDLEDGVFYVYVNGILARIYDCGHDNLIIGETEDWIFAKVQRHTDLKKGPYHGGLLIDNVSIGVEEYAYSDSYGKQFLTDELFENYTADLLTAIEGASIRFKAPAGLRFGSIVNAEKVAILKNLYGAENTKMGTIITPADYVTDEYEELDSLQGITREDLDGIEAGNSEGIAYLDIAFDGTYFQGDAAVNLEEGADYMVGSIVGLLQSNYERKFAGMGYIEFETENGVIGIYTDAIFRDIASVAEECLNEAEDDLTEEQQELLWCYVDGEQIPDEYMPEVEE